MGIFAWMPLASQIELPERYRVTRHIANGGMASVWEAEDQLLGRIVAVKVLGAHFAADPDARVRFQREARTAAQVSDHPHVVTIYDIGEHEDRAFIVMEHFAGGTVADRLRAGRDGSGPIARETALRWLREAAAGLDAAHAGGIVHRDVKPANLLLDTHGRLAVGDFGIARLADDTQMTSTGQVLGTAAYLSPEQALGQPATGASDRYALAVVAHELLTGRRPFSATHPAAQARQHVEVDPPRASDVAPGVPRAVDAVLARGMAKDPADRPGSATAFVDDLEDASAEQTPGTERMAPIKPRPPRRGAAAAGAAAAGAAAAGGALAADGAAQAADEADGAALAAGAAKAKAPPPSPPQPPPRAPASGGAARSGGAAPPVPPRPPARAHRDGPTIPPLALAAAAALLIGGLIALLAGGGNDPQRDSRDGAGSASRTTQRTQADEPAAQQPASAGQQPQQSSGADAEDGAGQGGDPRALNARGFQLLQSGQFGQAVEPLQAAVKGYRDAGRTSDLDYAYALYNLGVALNRSGNPQAAIPVLQERLKINNQRAKVQAELENAQARAAGAGGGGGGKADKTKDDKGAEDDGD